MEETLEAYRLDGGRYQRLEPNEQGRFPVAPLRVELGLWEGTYRGITGHWLRAWDAGAMFSMIEEREAAARDFLNLTGVGGQKPSPVGLRKSPIFYLLRTGCQWRYLPKHFPHKSTVWRTPVRLQEVPSPR